ncbi:DNA polymerase III subunit gamma/tau [bacterium]|nr:DNA polymerase III subunit gamma/tau [bacterium]
MTYTVLARRWRPTKFADVVGQEHITVTLQNAITSGRVAHAYIMTGPRGIGKTSTARILARAVNCLKGPAAEPCNECEICRQILDERSLDVVEIDGASNNSVDDIRKLRETVRLSPVSAKQKVYIIDEVHMLTGPAFNALLKTLEEPPEHVLFIFATTEIHKVPFTILSRVQRFDFHRIRADVMAAHLRKICEHDKIKIPSEALDIISRRAQGALRDAEGLLDQLIAYSGTDIPLEAVHEVLGILPREIIERTTEIIVHHDYAAALTHLSELADAGIDYGELLRSLEQYWMEQLFARVGDKSADKGDDSAAEQLSPEDLLRLIKLASEADSEIRRSPNPRMRFEVAFLRWVSLDRSVKIADILTKLRGAGAAPASPPPPKPIAPVVSTTTLPPESTPQAEPPEDATSSPTKATSPKKPPSEEKPPSQKPGDIDMFTEKFGGEILEVKDTSKTSPKKE